MNSKLKVIVIVSLIASSGFCEDIVARISGDDVISVISDRFISFSIDPRIIIENDVGFNDDCLCMANTLSPAYLKMSNVPVEAVNFDRSLIKLKSATNNYDDEYIEMNIDEFKKVTQWLKKARLTPIVALDNTHRFPSGNWNPKSAIQALTMVEQSNIGECVWQLGNEMEDITVQKYLNDLHMMKILIEGFSSGRNGAWKLVSSDVSKYLNENVTSDFEGFLSDANYFLDAVTFESETGDYIVNNLKDTKETLINEMKNKNTELWKIYDQRQENHDALTWAKSLGKSAQDGYSVVFKNLEASDVKNFSMNYFVSLVHKKFVGKGVLNVTTNSSNDLVSVFAHCGSIVNKPIPNGVTFFAVNEGDMMEKISFMASMTQDGQMMQFIMNQSNNGSIVVNGKKLLTEADIAPDLIPMKAFDYLDVKVPPKSIGFWVIPNMDVSMCSTNQNGDESVFYKQMGTGMIAETLYNVITNDVKTRRRRSIDPKFEEKQNEIFSKMDSLFDFMEEKLNETETNQGNVTEDELYALLENVDKMLVLESEFLKLGEELLSITRKRENPLVPLVRVIRDVSDNVQEETVNNEADKPEADKEGGFIFSRLNLPELKPNLTGGLSKILDTVRSLGKNLDMDAAEGRSSILGTVPNLKALIPPDAALKAELLNHDIRMGELRNKMKARIAELNLSSKLHQIRKRSVDYHTKYNEVISDLSKIDGDNESKDKRSELKTNDIEKEDSIVSDEFSFEDETSRECSVKEIKENFESFEMNETRLIDDMVKTVKGFFGKLQDKFIDWWGDL